MAIKSSPERSMYLDIFLHKPVKTEHLPTTNNINPWLFERLRRQPTSFNCIKHNQNSDFDPDINLPNFSFSERFEFVLLVSVFQWTNEGEAKVWDQQKSK